MIEYHPVSARDLSRLHQFGKKILPGIFLGYVLYAGRIRKGDILVADTEELERMDASEIHAWRLNAKEVLTPKNGEHFVLPIADGKSKTIWRHHVEPRVKLYVPREESIPITLRYIDVTRATSTTLDVLLEHRIDDYWNIEGAEIYQMR